MINSKNHNYSVTAEFCLASPTAPYPKMKAIVTFQEQSSKVTGHNHLQLEEAGQTSVLRNTPDQAQSQEQSAVCTSSASALNHSAHSVKQLPGVDESEMPHILIYHLKQ